jgi:hypothetical protein
MKKEYIIGGLAIVGAVALFAYLKPKATRRNSEGFFNLGGKDACNWCQDSQGKYYISGGTRTGGVRNCGQDKCVSRTQAGYTIKKLEAGGNDR